MDNIKLNKVILHILDTNHEAPIISARELEPEGEISDFLEKHITKILNEGNLKQAFFESNGNEVYELCSKLGSDGEQFVHVSSELAQKLFFLMKQYPDIPSADVLFCIFESGSITCFAILKLNYRHSYIHYVSNTTDGNVNNIIKQKTTLPAETQKVDECIIIDLSNFGLKILEKQYEIDAKKEYYLSKYFLRCKSDLSYLQKIKILDKTVSKITKKNLNEEDFKKVTKLRTCLAESIEETNEIKVDEVADYVFGDNVAFKQEYIEEVKKEGLTEKTISVPEVNQASKKFKTQKLKTDSGIEINFPSQFYNNTDYIEFINNPDGSISILIKNINKVVNK